MKILAQISTLIGLIVSGIYSYFNNFCFEGIVALLSFTAAFASTFFFGNSSKMQQKLGGNSKGYQAGRDINIKE